MSGRQDDDAMAARGPEGLDPRLERALHDVLGARDPGPAPVGLRTLVDRVPDHHPPARPHIARQVAGWLAATAAALVILGIGTTLLRPMAALGPGQPGATLLPSGADPLLQAGIGIVEAPNQTLIVLVVIVLTLAAFVGSAAVTGRRSGVLALLVVLIPGAFLASQVLPPPALAGGGTGQGLITGASLGIPDGDRQQFWVVAEPGDPYQVALVVANPGPLPMRLDGILGEQGATPGEQPSLWFDLESDGSISNPVRPFEPVVLAPGEQIDLWLIGRASSCAVGPAFAESPYGAFQQLQAIPLRWSIAGLVPRVDALELSYYITTPMRDGCPG